MGGLINWWGLHGASVQSRLHGLYHQSLRPKHMIPAPNMDDNFPSMLTCS
jgi:hypothetical protein